MPRVARPKGKRTARRAPRRKSGGKAIFARIVALSRLLPWGKVRDMRLSLGRFAAISLGDLPKFQFPTPLWVILSPPGHPDKRRLMTVQDFFKYTEDEGVKFFEELDRNADGKVSLEDMKVAMRKRKLPEKYAREFVHHARGRRWWSKTLSWDEFKAVVDERESEMLRAFTHLAVNQRGQVEVGGLKDSLRKLGLPATDENAKAMLKAIGSEEDGFVSYGRFRNFAILLPKHKLRESVDPSRVWFESATMVPIGLPTQVGESTTKMLLTAALAGGLASGASTFLMHPVDTLKTRIQSSVGGSAMSVVRSVPQIGGKALYRGVVPATAGSGLSHGVRMCAYEGCFKILSTLTGGAAEVQLQGVASGVGTFLGTAFRIPCEVLKQRLQVGQHKNVSQALTSAIKADGPQGLFRGTGATLSREVPFYVCGMVFYQQLKRLFRGDMFGGIGRELKPWETLMVGALSGALGAIVTTPADVMKTRIMTAAAGQPVSASQILIDILRVEGFPALFKGALPRAVWIAPLGAMNFAGYELAKNALTEADKRHRKAAEPEPEPEPEVEKVPQSAIQNWFKKPSWWPELPQKPSIVEQPALPALAAEASVAVKGSELGGSASVQPQSRQGEKESVFRVPSSQERLKPQPANEITKPLPVDQRKQTQLPRKSPRATPSEPGKLTTLPRKSPRGAQSEQGKSAVLPGKSPRGTPQEQGRLTRQLPGKSPRGVQPEQGRTMLPGKSPRSIQPETGALRPELPGKSPRGVQLEHAKGRPPLPSKSPRSLPPEKLKAKPQPMSLPPRAPTTADNPKKGAPAAARPPLAPKQPLQQTQSGSDVPELYSDKTPGAQRTEQLGTGATRPTENDRSAAPQTRKMDGSGDNTVGPAAVASPVSIKDIGPTSLGDAGVEKPDMSATPERSENGAVAITPGSSRCSSTDSRSAVGSGVLSASPGPSPASAASPVAPRSSDMQQPVTAAAGADHSQARQQQQAPTNGRKDDG